MAQVIARIKKNGKHFEILVDMDLALKFKKGEGEVSQFLEIDRVFWDSKKGDVPSKEDILEAFGTEDIYKIAEKIVKEGEIQVTQEHRSEEQEAKIKQVVDFLSRNAIDPQTGNPLTSERIKNSLNEARINIKNVPVENQIQDIVEHLSKILPIKIETKKIELVVPAIYTGKAYGILAQYKEREEWLDDGSLKIRVNVPAGLLMDFYDKINGVTHGSATSEEINEK
jgi:ribosome maturation protein SDO1